MVVQLCVTRSLALEGQRGEMCDPCKLCVHRGNKSSSCRSRSWLAISEAHEVKKDCSWTSKMTQGGCLTCALVCRQSTYSGVQYLALGTNLDLGVDLSQKSGSGTTTAAGGFRMRHAM